MMADRLLIGWSLIVLLALSVLTAAWLVSTRGRRTLRRERREEVRRAARTASRGLLPSDGGRGGMRAATPPTEFGER